MIAGGHAAFNPEPIADFVDAAVLGDGEQAVGAITDIVRDWKAGRPPGRAGRAAAAAGRAPAASTSRASTTSATCPTAASSRSRPNRAGVPERVTKHTVMNLDEWPYPKTPLVPLAETVHERMSVEIFRGCTRGCRFCQAGMITRPVRERSIDGIGEMVAQRPGRHRLRGGRAALAVQSADHSEIGAARQAARRPLRGRQGQPVAAVHPGRRVQHRPRQRVLPQRPPLRPDVRPRGRLRAAAPRDQQDGQQGRPDPHRLDRLRAGLAAGEAVLHVRPADRDRRGRPRDRRDGARRHPRRTRGRRAQGHPLHRVDRRVRAQAAHPVPVGRAGLARGRRRPAAQAARRDQREQVARPQRRHALPRRRAVARRRAALARRPPGRRGDRAGVARRRPLRRLVASTSPSPAGSPAPRRRAAASTSAWYTTRERDGDEVLPWDHLDSGLDKQWLWDDWQDALGRVRAGRLPLDAVLRLRGLLQPGHRHPDRPDRPLAAPARPAACPGDGAAGPGGAAAAAGGAADADPLRQARTAAVHLAPRLRAGLRAGAAPRRGADGVLGRVHARIPKISYVGAAPTGVGQRGRVPRDRAGPASRTRTQCGWRSTPRCPPAWTSSRRSPPGPGSLAERMQASHWRIELPGVSAEAAPRRVEAVPGRGPRSRSSG